jgi:hypothetical protein
MVTAQKKKGWVFWFQPELLRIIKRKEQAPAITYSFFLKKNGVL